MTITRDTFYTMGIMIMTVIIMIYAQFILVPLLLAGLFAILLHPAVVRVQKLLKSYIVSFVACIASVLALLSVPLFFLVGHLDSIVTNIDIDTDTISTQVSSLSKRLSQNALIGNYVNEDMLTQQISGVVSGVQSVLQLMLVDGSSALFTLFTAILFAYFLGAYYQDLRDTIVRPLAKTTRESFRAMAVGIPEVLRGYVKGLFYVMVIVALMNGALLLIVGLDYAIMWAVIIGVLTLIPYVGSAIGLLLPFSYSMLTSDSMEQPLFIVLGFLVIQQIEGNFITPKIVGDQININPFIIIIVMLSLAKIWGIVGVILALPLMGVIKVILDKYFDAEVLSEIIAAKD